MLCVENGQYLRTRNLAEVKTGFHDMLNLLGVDYIDVGLIHYCDSLSDWQNILDKGGLDYAETLKNAGKIGHIGLSSHNPVVARKAVETGKIEVLMFSVNPCYDLQPADENVEKSGLPKPMTIHFSIWTRNGKNSTNFARKRALALRS